MSFTGAKLQFLEEDLDLDTPIPAVSTKLDIGLASDLHTEHVASRSGLKAANNPTFAFKVTTYDCGRNNPTLTSRPQPSAKRFYDIDLDIEHMDSPTFFN